jgi:hypothetical protein
MGNLVEKSSSSESVKNAIKKVDVGGDPAISALYESKIPSFKFTPPAPQPPKKKKTK